MNLKEITSVWKKVFSSWRYLLSLVLIAISFFVINVIIKNFSTIKSFYISSGFFGTLKFILILTIGFRVTTTTGSFISLIVISILLGMLFSLIFYKIVVIKTAGKIGLLGTIGIFLGVAAPGCAACGVGLLALFGIGAATLYSLPLKGLEISILAIVILVFSVYKISGDLHKGNVCEVNVNNSERRYRE